MRRGLRRLLLVFISLLALILAIPLGFKLAVMALPYLHTGLVIERVEAEPGSGLTLTGIDYRNASLHVHCDRLQWVMQPRDLLHGQFHLISLEVTGIRGETSALPQTPQAAFDPRRLLPPIPLRIDRLSVEDVSWQNSGQTEALRIDHLATALELDRKGLTLQAFTLANPLGHVQLDGGWQPDQTDPLQARIDWQLSLPQQPALKGQGEVSGDWNRLVFRQNLLHPVPAGLHGTLSLTEQGPRGQATLILPEVPLDRLHPGSPVWPLRLEVQAESQGQNLLLRANGHIVVPELGPVTLKGRLDYGAEGELKLSPLELASDRMGGRVVVEGLISRPDRFDLTARWQTLMWPLVKPVVRSAEGQLKIRGSLADVQAELHGLLQQRPVDASARLSVADHQLHIHPLILTAAQTRLDLNGRYGETLDLSWTLDAGNLGLLLEGATGKLTSRGQLTGSPRWPVIDMEARGTALALRTVSVQNLQLQAKTGARPDAPAHLTLDVDALHLGAERFDVHLQAGGTAQNHQLTVRVNHPRYPLLLDVNGAWNQQNWRGSIQRFDWNQPGWGLWALQQPALLSVRADGLDLGELCWRHEAANGCGSGQIRDGRWQLKSHLTGLPISRLMPPALKNPELEGSLQAEAELAGQGSHLETSRFDLHWLEPLVRYRLAETPPWQIVPRTASLQAKVTQGQGTLTLHLDDPAFASLSGQLASKGPFDLARMGSLPLSGHFDLDLPDLGVIEPERRERPARLSGHGHLSLDIGGNAQTPRLQLQGGISQGRLALPNLGIQLTDVNVEAMPTIDAPNRVMLQGRARSGSGSLRIEGSGLLDAAQNWPWNLHLSGENFQLMHTRDADLLLSPDLAFKTQGSALSVQGRARIPHARITLPERQVIKASADTVRIDQPASAQKTGLDLTSLIELELGEDVNFSGQGVNARLGGHLHIEQQPGAAASATGQILLKEGQYTFHTVKLPLTGGRLAYNHAPLDNPELDFDVVRRVDNVTAGVRVLGVLQNPSFTLHSDPVMAESDILAYLISGKSMNLSSNQEGRLMQEAAASLSGPVGNLLMKEVTGRFGLSGLLDDVSVQSPTGSNQSTALFLGKYLTPRLYLQYGMGLVQTSNVFKIRYELGKHWKIQSETGEHSGGDILFELEK